MTGLAEGCSENSSHAGELLEIRKRCKELRKEKEMLKDSQNQSFELIRKLELHVQALSEAHIEDRKRIQELERELNNCSQEIDYLQDQLNSRTTELNHLGEHVCNLQLKLAFMENLEEETEKLREELKLSDAECKLLAQKLENKQTQLRDSLLNIEKMEESMFSGGLEHQCEIESMKLELVSLEESFFEAKKSRDEIAQENTHLTKSIQDLELRIFDAEKVIEVLDKENEDLKEQLKTSGRNAKIFCQKAEKQLHQLFGNYDNPFFSELENNIPSPSEVEENSSCGDILGPLLSKLTVLRAGITDPKQKREKLSCQIDEYESLIKQLKDELREEKMRAKEEAEDLAQEMAELRYQITGLLEEECKRRACVEQISLQRIAELEAQIEEERGKSFTHQDQKSSIVTVRHVDSA